MGRAKRGVALNIKVILRNIIVICLAIVVAIGATGAVKAKLMRSTVELVACESGAIYDTVSLSGLVLVEESVVYSDHPGRFTASLREGDKIGAGQEGGRLKLSVTDLVVDGRVEAVKAPKAGIISYVFDGFENILTPEVTRSLNLVTLRRQLSNYESYATADTQVARGDPLLRVIDNTAEPHYFAVVAPENYVS